MQSETKSPIIPIMSERDRLKPPEVSSTELDAIVDAGIASEPPVTLTHSPLQVFQPAMEAFAATLWRDPGALVRLNKSYYEAKGEPIVIREAETPLPIRLNYSVPLTVEQVAIFGGGEVAGVPMMTLVRDAMFQAYSYGDKTTAEEHVALMKEIGDGEDVPIRIHSSCLTAETFHASNCDCHEQLEAALQITEKEGRGGVIWLHQEGRGNGLAAKFKQIELMVREGVNTVDAYEQLGYPSDQRDFTAAVHILNDLGIKSVRLITNNPDKIGQLQDMGIKVTGRIPCVIPPYNEMVRKDLKAKKDRHGHDFGDQEF